MSEAAAISGTFADFKLVKTRSAAQIVVEVNIEDADRVLNALGGVPQPGKENPVAIARLNPESKPEPTKERRKFDELKRSQQAGIACNEGAFQKFIEEKQIGGPWRLGREEDCASDVRWVCGVNSRAQFDTNEQAAAKWDTLYSEYVDWCGR